MSSYYKMYLKYKKRYHLCKHSQTGGSYKTCLKDLFDEIKKYYDVHKGVKFSLKPKSGDINSVTNSFFIKHGKIPFNNLFSGPFMPNKIREAILKMDFSETTVDGTGFLFSGLELDDIKRKMVVRTLVLNSILKPNSKPTIIYAATPFKKVVPNKGNIVDVENVNSGFSTNQYSVVYREEEALKVLVHELFHQYQTDCGFDCHFSKHPVKYVNPDSKDRDLLVNESLVETLATIVNCMFKVLENGGSSFDSCENMLNKEREFVLGQSAKIMEIYNLEEPKEIFSKQIKTGASIVEYYIFKAAALNCLEEFISFLTAGGDHVLKFNRAKGPKLITVFINFVKKPSFGSSIKNIDKNGSTNGSTMKMTIYG